MAVQMPGNLSPKEVEIDLTRKWHFSKEEIEFCTPSRADGIDSKYESHLRRLYCSFIHELGVGLNVHQLTIATALMFCHRFYMRQSHAKNDWKTVATVCMFLAGKAEETPRYLDQIIVVANKLINGGDSSAPQKMTKDLITMGERLLLTTLAFNLKIEHPHKALVAVLKKMETGNKELVKMAWTFVNDWLHTSLCLRYKPHYIAAGSIFLAAKVLNVTLPRVDGNVWWMQLDVTSKRLDEVVKQMQGYLAQIWKQNPTAMGQRRIDPEPVIRNGNFGSAQSCTTSGSINVQDSEIIASMETCGPTKSSTSIYNSRRQEDNESIYRSTRQASGSVNMRDLEIIASKDTCEPTKPSMSKYSSRRQEDNDNIYRSTRQAPGSVNMRDSEIIASRDTCEPTKPSMSKYSSWRQEDNDSIYRSTRQASGSVNMRDSEIIASMETSEPTKSSISKYSNRRQEDNDSIRDSEFIASRDICEPTKPSMSKYSCRRRQEDTDIIYRTTARGAWGLSRQESEEANSGVDDYYEREPRKRSPYQFPGYSIYRITRQASRSLNMRDSEIIASRDTYGPTKPSMSKYSSRRQEDTDGIYRTTTRGASSLSRKESEKTNSVGDYYERKPRKRSPYQFSSYVKVSTEGGDRKRRRCEVVMNGNSAECWGDEKGWIEKKLENGIEFRSTIYVKSSRQRL